LLLGKSSLTASVISALVVVSLLVSSPVCQAQTFAVLHNFTGGQDGAAPVSGLTIDAAGNLYGTTLNGGSQNCFEGCGVVFKLTHKNGAWTLAPLYEFAGGTDAYWPSARVVFGPEGTLYGTSEYGGTGCSGEGGCGTVFNLRPPPTVCRSVLCPWVENILYSFQNTPDGWSPYASVSFDQSGNLYGTTSGGGLGYGVAYKLSKMQSSWTESVIYSFNFQDGFLPNAELTPDQSGNLYGTTEAGGTNNEGTVFELTPSGSDWTENVLVNFPGSSNGLSPLAGVAFDPSGNLYGATAFTNNAIVFELTPSGGNWDINTLYTFGGPSGSGSAGPLETLTVDAGGSLYGVTSAYGAYGFGNVFKLTRSGNGWTYSDLHDFTGGSDGGGGLTNVVLDANGNLYGTAEFGGTNNKGVVWEITP
jgi:uncharacterized repeat protein (TIGR03803 family)